MTVSSTTNSVRYTGNGAVDTYAYTFKIFDESELLVTVRDTDGEETTLAISTDYTVSGVGDSAGGNVALVDNNQDWIDADGDLKSGYTLTIRRVLELKQETDIRNQGDSYKEVLEDQHDKQIMISQQQQNEIDKSLKLPETVLVADFDPTLPADIAGAEGKVPVTNDDGDGWAPSSEWPTAGEITAAAANATDAGEHRTTASRWATKTDGSVVDADTGVDSGDHSSKAYAIGGTGVTNTAGKGAAKEWATKTSSTVDGSEYSAKEYAQGTQAGAGGSAKDWAQKTSAAVTGSSYSAKEHATGTQTRGTSGGGSAKDWATYTGGTVDDTERSAKYYAQQAAAALASATGLAEYANDAAFVTANGTAENGDCYYNTTTHKMRLYANSQWINVGGGGGGGALQWVEDTDSPIPAVEYNNRVYQFGAGISQSLYALVRVPSEYSAGSPISLRMVFYSPDVVGTVAMLAQATLVRTGTDAMSSTTNQRTTTNASVNLATAALANKPYAMVLDISSSTGQINGVSVAAGDLTKVRLYRDTDTATSDVRVPVYGAEVTFS